MQNYSSDSEEEETLSFCDLPLNSDAASFDEHSQEHQTSSSSASSSSSYSSSSSFDQDLFEFFTGSALWNGASSNIASDNILFCGKLIPSKKPIPTVEFSLSHSQTSTTPQKKTGLSRRNSDSSFYKHTSKTVLSSNIATTPRSNSMSFPINTVKSFAKKEILPKKRSLLLSSPTKSRWFVFLFGRSSLPKKMELSDLRNRQTRRSNPSTMFQTDGDENEEMDCGGHRPNTSRKASFGCFGGL